MALDKSLIEKSIEVISTISKKFGEMEAWTIRSIIELGTEIVTEVEKLSQVMQISSDEKLELASKVLDHFIKLPFYLEIIDDKIIRVILELIVNVLNKVLGKDWLKKIETAETVN